MIARTRVLEFPKGKSLGKLLRRRIGDDRAPWRPLGEAEGAVEIAPYDAVLLRLAASATANPAVLRDLPAEGIEALDLTGTWNTDVALRHLQHLTGLRALNLSFTDVSDSGLAFLRPLVRLRDLNLLGTGIGNVGLAHLVALPALDTLGLARTAVTGDGLLHLRQATALQRLYLMDTQVHIQGLYGLSGLHDLRALGLRNTSIGSAEMLHLRSLVRLRHLDLGNTRVGNEGLSFLRGLVPLERLDLDATGTGDSGLEALHNLVALRRLDVSRTGVTSRGIAALQAAHPGCRIYWSGGMYEANVPPTRGELLDALEEIIRAPVRVGTSRWALGEEVQANSWHVALSESLAREISVAELVDFLDRLVRRKGEIVARTHAGHGMVLYVWFDPLAVQLRLNLVSDFHSHLPLDQVLWATRPHDIVEDFLRSKEHDAISLQTAASIEALPGGSRPIAVYAVRVAAAGHL